MHLWCYLNPIKTSCFQMGLCGFDIWKSGRIGAYGTKVYLSLSLSLYIYIYIYMYIKEILKKKKKSHGRQQPPGPSFALHLIMVRFNSYWYYSCHISWDVRRHVKLQIFFFFNILLRKLPFVVLLFSCQSYHYT